MTITYTRAVGDQLMTTAQVSEYLQVPVATLHQWRYKGVGPRAAAVGRHLRWRRADVDHWLEQQTATPDA